MCPGDLAVGAYQSLMTDAGGFDDLSHFDDTHPCYAAVRPEQTGQAIRIITSCYPGYMSALELHEDGAIFDLRIWDFNANTETLGLVVSSPTGIVLAPSLGGCRVSQVELRTTYATSLVYGPPACGRLDIWEPGESALRARPGPSIDVVQRLQP